MRQENPAILEESKAALDELLEIRGTVGEFHKKIANDPDLLRAFGQTYQYCNKGSTHIGEKYKDLIIFAIGCAQGNRACILNHSALAVKNGATVEEIGDVLKLVFLMCGSTGIMNAADVFDAIDV